MSSKCNIYPVEGSQIKNGHYVILRSSPCKINQVDHIKNGKHGGAKFKISGFNILTGKKVEYTGPGDERVLRFVPIKTKLTMMSYDKDTFECIDESDVASVVTVRTNTEKYAKFVESYNSDREYSVEFVTIPIMIGEDDFNDVNLLDSYKVEPVV